MAKPNSDNAGSSDGRFYDATAKFFITFPFPTKNVLCVMIPIEKIVPYPDNYYGVGGDADGQEYEGCRVLGVIESILSKGLLAPFVVRSRGDGTYALLVGRMKYEACKLLVADGDTKYKRVPCKIVPCTNDLYERG